MKLDYKKGDKVIVLVDANWKEDWYSKTLKKEQFEIEVDSMTEFLGGGEVIKTYINGAVTYFHPASVIENPKPYCNIPNYYQGEGNPSILDAVLSGDPELPFKKFPVKFSTVGAK